MFSRDRIDTIRRMRVSMKMAQCKNEELILYRLYGVKPRHFPELMDEEVG